MSLLQEQSNIDWLISNTQPRRIYDRGSVQPLPEEVYKILSISSACSSELIDVTKVKCVTQGKYCICVPNNTDKPIIASFGAAGCIILAMRSRVDGTLVMAHIDSMILEAVDTFNGLLGSTDIDVYIVGGNESTLDIVNNLLIQLKENNFTDIKLAYIIDSKINSLAINCENGDTYLNFSTSIISRLDCNIDVSSLFRYRKLKSI